MGLRGSAVLDDEHVPRGDARRVQRERLAEGRGNPREDGRIPQRAEAENFMILIKFDYFSGIFDKFS